MPWQKLYTQWENGERHSGGEFEREGAREGGGGGVETEAEHVAVPNAW